MLPAAAPTYWRARIAPDAREKYGKSFVIENRPGAGTTIAATATAKAAPDGYTLMQATSGTMAMDPSIFKHLSYEPLKTLVPVSLVAGVPFVLTVNPTLPVHSVADLVALAKKRSADGKPLTYGSGGVGAFHHLCAELFSSLTGIKMTHVPYRGSVPSTMALISGQIDVLFVDLGPMLPRFGPARPASSASPVTRCSRRPQTSSRLPRSACRLGRTLLPGRCCSRPAARRSRSSKS